MIVKTKSKAKPQAKSKPAKSKSATSAKPKSVTLKKSKPLTLVKTKVSRSDGTSSDKARVVHRISVPNANSAERKSKGSRVPQYNFMKAPGMGHDFQVGDSVEVYCDHEKNRDRVRGWIGGVVVQVDNKMVAVQFRSNVFLTDGWMVPDRILWYPLASEHIRPMAGKKPIKREKAIPDY